MDFTSNDYLGLAQHPQVIAAGAVVLQKYGAGARSSRLVNGNFPLYDELEAKLAEHKGYEAACIFGSGYLANIGVIPAIMGEGDLIIADKLAHACLIDAAKLSGAKLVRFKHNCMEHLEALLQKRGEYENCLIITEEIFSMDGDKAPLAKICELKKKYDAWVLVDGAHSIYDSPAHNPPLQGGEERGGNVDIYIGTMSKALGCYGGYVCASKTVIEYIKTSARSLIYSTALPPGIIASALQALAVIESEKPYLRLEKQAHIIPIIVGDEQKTLEIAEALKAKKILVSAIRPPTVPKGTARLRISITANHSCADIEKLFAELGKLGVCRDDENSRIAV